MTIIDAHTHLWLRQDTVVNGQPIRQLTPNRSRSLFFGEERQMLPPFMTDGANSAERLLSNMDYARVGAAVVTQEFIDGLQNDYLADVQRRYPDRLFCFAMPDFRLEGYYEAGRRLLEEGGFRGIKVPAARLIGQDWRVRMNDPEMMRLCQFMEQRGDILHVELADGDTQVGELREVIEECPRLRVVIGHFGMVTRPGWMQQILLARYPNVYIESGGITWLFNDEFYPFPSAIRAIREAADAVGFEKLMWGSDYPRTITAITYRMSYDFLLRSSLLAEDELTAFLGENAQRLFDFKDLPELPYIKNMSE